MKSKLQKKNKGIVIKTVLFIGIFNFFVLPIQVNSANSRTVNLQQKQINLVSILEKIEQQVQVNFIYNSDVKQIKRKVDISYQNEPLVVVMNDLARLYGLGYKIQNRNITVYEERKPVHQMERLIKGSVTDEGNVPVIGASIRIKGTQQGVVTDFDGNFQITVRTGDVLEISFLGMETQTYTIGAEINQLSIQLSSNDQQLSEVVVVGYGQKTEESLAAAVNKIDVHALSDRPVGNAVISLQGLSPGLNVTRTSGRPTDEPNINIRGFTSINSGEPLIIIDGVEGDINNINPSDIESISVLKDAGASAIYGARGAFGVVLITTKRAREGELKVNVESVTAWSKTTTRTDFVTDPYEAIKIADTFFRANSGTSYSGYTDEDYERLREVSENPELARVITDTRNGREQYVHYAKTDWWNYFFRNSRPSRIINGSISGGNDQLKGYFSYRNYREEGILKVQKDLYKKQNYRAKLELKLNDWISFRDNMQFSSANDLQHGGYRGGWHRDIWNYIIYNHAMPWYSPVNNDGSFFFRSELNNYAAGDGVYASLLYGKAIQETRNSDFSNIVSARFTPVKGLEVNTNYTYRRTDMNRFQRSTEVPYTIYTNGPQTMGIDELTEYNTFTDYDAFNIYGNYDQRFGKHHLNLMAGFGQEAYYSKNIQASTLNNISDDLNSLGLGTGGDQADGSAYEWALQGAYTRLSYDFFRKYFLEFNARYDGTSRFPSEDRWGFFPSVSAAWLVNKENFIHNIEQTLSLLKLRISYGALGNQEVSPYAYQPVLMRSVQEDFAMNGEALEYINPPALNPSEITWEKVKTLNLGIDIGLFQNKFNMKFDWFKRETLGMLTAGKVVPATLGTSAPQENAADLATKGFELALGYNNRFDVAGSPLLFSFSAGLSNSKTRITKFDNPKKLLGNYYEGMTIGELWGYHVPGLFQSGEEIASHADQSAVSTRIIPRGGLQPGDVKYADLNGDGYVTPGDNTLNNPGDRRIIGNVAPQYLYNFRFTVEWKGFDLSAFFQGVGKQDWYPYTDSQLFWGPYSRPYASFVRKDLANNIWSEDNRDAYFPRAFGYIALGSTNTLGAVNDRYMQSIAYLRLKNLTIGYSLPDKILARTPFSKLRFFLSGENILTFTGLTGYVDPEAASNAVNLNAPSTSTIGAKGQVAPFSETYSAGISLQF